MSNWFHKGYGDKGKELLVNGNFTAWTGDDPDGWTVVEVGDATSNVTENPAGNCQLISTGALVQIAQGGLVVGQRYQFIAEVSAVSSGNLSIADTFGNGAPKISATGTYKYTGIATSTTLVIKRGTGAGDNATLDSVSVKQTGILASSVYPGANVIINGDFAAGTNWTKGDAAITIAGGKATWSGAQAGNADLTATVAPLLAGIRYKITYTVSGYSAGSITPLIGTTAGTAQSANGTFTEERVAATTAFVLRGDADFAGSVEIVTVQPADPMNLTNVGLTAGVLGSGNVPYVMLSDAVNDVAKFDSIADVNSKINWGKGGIMMVASAATWAAGVDVLARFAVDDNNEVVISRSGTDLLCTYRQASTASTVTIASGSPTGLFTIGISWDVAGVGLQAFYKGVQSGADVAIAAAIVGNLGITKTCFFAATTAPANVWAGNGAFAVLWTLSTPAIADHADYAQKSGLA